MTKYTSLRIHVSLCLAVVGPVACVVLVPETITQLQGQRSGPLLLLICLNPKCVILNLKSK